VEVDHRRIGSGQVGPLVKRLQTLYYGVVRGEYPRYAHWLTPVFSGAEAGERSPLASQVV
jgi:branched-chain amino acid aminotransferase